MMYLYGIVNWVYRLYFPYKKLQINKTKYNRVMSIYSSLALPMIDEYEKELFDYDGTRLIISDVSSLIKPFTYVVVGGIKQLIGVECWITGEYKLNAIKCNNFRPLLLEDSEYIFWKAGGLYRQIGNHPIERLCDFSLPDFMYCDMLHSEMYYVLRSGGNIYITKDLHHWETIYSGKRGIKDSMVMVGSGDSLSLLFIEYTPGTQRTRHHIMQYLFKSGRLNSVFTFYTYNEFLSGLGDVCARHIHVISKDPFTNDIYVGTGDNDEESSLFVSKDNGTTFTKLLSGSQNYRALSFFYTEDYVFWNTDTHESQAIYRMNRRNTKDISRFPLINGALWCSGKFPGLIDGNEMYIMTSNSEGALYDNNNRVYGITLHDNIPHIYELLCRRSRTQYSQQFLLGFDNERHVVLFDHEIGKVNCYTLERLK